MGESGPHRDFGERVAGVEYIDRPSAYAIIRNETGEVAVMYTLRGCFTPGGGLHRGERRTAQHATRAWKPG